MSFELEALTKDAEFFSDAKTCPATVEGAGQMVYWQDCVILVYKAGNTLAPMEEHRTCSGQGRVKRGTWLVFMGKNGKMIEED